MPAYLIKRFIQSIITLLAIITLTFVIIRLAPGGPEVILGGEVSAEELLLFRAKLGLDQPVHIQYLKWFGALLRGDLGKSYIEHRPVITVIGERVPNTLLLTLSAFFLSLLLSIPLGVVSAMKPYRWFDYAITSFSLIGISTPVFWAGILLMIIFAVKLGLLPSAGMATIEKEFSIADRLAHLIMPVTVLTSYYVAQWTRYARSSMLEVIGEDYIRTARAKGLAERGVVFKHALKNALIPVVTIIGLSLPGLVGGAAITETVFAWPGMGRLAVTAAFRRDYPVIMGILVIFSAMVVISSMLIDILYMYLDPRVRLE